MSQNRDALAPDSDVYLQQTKDWGLDLIRDFLEDISSAVNIALKIGATFQKLNDAPLDTLEETLESIISQYSNENPTSDSFNQTKLQFLFLLLKFKHALYPLSQQSQMLMKRWDSVNRTPQRVQSTFMRRSPIKSEPKRITPESSPKRVVFGSPSNSKKPLCRICECAISADDFYTHTINCLECHSMKLEWSDINEEIEKQIPTLKSHEQEMLQQVIKNCQFTSSMSLFLSANFIKQVKSNNLSIPPTLFELVKRRHHLMKHGIQKANVATSSIATNDSPNYTEGYAMPPLPPPRLRDFKIIAPISRGAYGSVFLCQRIQTGDVFALKVIPADDLSMKNDVLDTEREVMCRALHPSTISLFWSFRASSTVFFVMSFARGGDLYALLESVGSLDEEVAAFYVAELVLAIEYIHSLNVVHCDLKPDNILINDSGHLQLTDFGLSKFGLEQRELGRSLMFRFAPSSATKSDTNDHKRRVIGTPHYISPESLLRSDYSPKVDWWALGVIAYELVVGEPPFGGNSEAEIFSHIVAGKYEWPDDVEVSDEYKKFVHDLLNLNPEKRPDAEELKKYKIFEDIDWENLYNTNAPFVTTVSDGFDLQYFENSRNSGTFNIEDIDELKAAAAAREKPDEWCCTNIAALAERNKEVCKSLNL